MNNKLAYFVIGAILVVIAGASVLLLLNNQKQKPSSSTGEVHKQGTPTKNLSELQKQGWVGNITIIEGSALPEILTIEKDWAVSFTNQSTKDIEINITGDRDLMVVKIPAGKNYGFGSAQPHRFGLGAGNFFQRSAADSHNSDFLDSGES